jgi:CheY-like chemotaxis protein
MVLVALTGWGQDDDRRRSKAAGFDHHMAKPVDLGVLMRLLAEAPRSQHAALLAARLIDGGKLDG